MSCYDIDQDVPMTDELNDADYRALAGFRFELRRFLGFSEQAATAAGLTPQQHQALLAIRAAEHSRLLVGELAECLLLKPHSTSELVRRLESQGMVARRPDERDRRRVHIVLTPRAHEILNSLSLSHRAELRRLGPLLRQLLEAF